MNGAESEPATKRHRADDDCSASDARARAMALLKAKATQAADPASPSDGAAQYTPTPVHGATSDAADPAQQEVEATYDDDYNGDWAEDAHYDEQVPFTEGAEEDGQDFDHTLNANEMQWESTSVARSLPPGWAKCPNSGAPVFGGVHGSLGFLAMKAPYGGNKGRRIPPAYQWSPSDVIQYVEEQHGRVLGLVVQLTFSDKYYSPSEFTAPRPDHLAAQHIWIKLRGHGELPSAKDVNNFVFLVHRATIHLQAEREMCLAKVAESEERGDAANKKAYEKARLGVNLLSTVKAKKQLLENGPFAVVVHCTHGFNRSGSMIIHYVKRLFPSVSVADCVRKFAEARKPGIYKDEYIQALFDYYHEERIEFGPGAVEVPLPPSWKPDDGSPEHFDQVDNSNTAVHAEMQHDDDFGEEIHEDDAAIWRAAVAEEVRDKYVAKLRSDTTTANPTSNVASELQRHQRAAERSRHHFPGSQPVSLSSSNQGLVGMKRYWFTWKADGTRYLMYVAHTGTYLIDRRMKVSRCQMRFPRWHRRALMERARQLSGDNAAKFDTEYERTFFDFFARGKLGDKKLLPDIMMHHGTLMDGELVIDTHPNGRKERTYYVYDLISLHGFNVLHRPWKERWMLINEVTEPREFEAALIADRGKNWPHRYKYGQEVCKVVRKNFWPLHCVRNVLRDYIPKLKHENDGLILQSYMSPYVPDACEDILKWKPASHNSVDFMLLSADDERVQSDACGAAAASKGQRWFLGVSERHRVVLAFDLDEIFQSTDVPARVQFPPELGASVSELAGVVIECNFANDTWGYMRERSKDKDMPNALGTYQKVVQSIRDAMNEDDIYEEFDLAYENNLNHVYDKDKAARDHERQKGNRLKAAPGHRR